MTDHIIVRLKIAFTLRKAIIKTKGFLAHKLNVEQLRNEEVFYEFQEDMDETMDY